ncbi:hypothetical protein F4775DRAFT_531053 [Biscogniauxia sp. FL1348]|nr:hypothetical protein F4775DRAFT_531053 [Biscogniauxia sp. FL1348]
MSSSSYIITSLPPTLAVAKDPILAHQPVLPLPQHLFHPKTPSSHTSHCRRKTLRSRHRCSLTTTTTTTSDADDGVSLPGPQPPSFPTRTKKPPLGREDAFRAPRCLEQWQWQWQRADLFQLSLLYHDEHARRGSNGGCARKTTTTTTGWEDEELALHLSRQEAVREVARQGGDVAGRRGGMGKERAGGVPPSLGVIHELTEGGSTHSLGPEGPAVVDPLSGEEDGCGWANPETMEGKVEISSSADAEVHAGDSGAMPATGDPLDYAG